MPDSNYTSTPPTASEVQVLAMREKIDDICKHVEKLSDLPQKIDRMSLQLEQLNRDHQQTRIDLKDVRESFDDELTKVKTDIRDLQTSKTRIDTLSDWFKWGGLALIGLIISGWVNLTSKMDITAVQSASNSQRVESVEKTQEDNKKLLGDIQTNIKDLQMDMYKRGQQ